MKFTIEQTVIQKMLTLATRLLPKKSRLGYAVLPRPVLLKACAGWVFIEGPDSMAVGREALVLKLRVTPSTIHAPTRRNCFPKARSPG